MNLDTVEVKLREYESKFCGVTEWDTSNKCVFGIDDKDWYFIIDKDDKIYQYSNKSLWKLMAGKLGIWI